MKNFKFKRLFATCMYKNKKLHLARMSFAKDFINTDKGTPYPIIYKSVDAHEKIDGNRYYTTSGKISRFFCSFFPFATYELTVLGNNSIAGFEFRFPETTFNITLSQSNIIFFDGDTEKSAILNVRGEETTLIITCRPKVFDVYILNNDKPEYICTFTSDKLYDMNKENVFKNSYVCLYCENSSTIKNVVSYLDSGIADIRPVKYENGDVIYENGKIYLTASIRLQEEMYQGVFSWVPGTCEFELCGALFFNCGDGYIWGNVASSLKFDRNKKMWYLWVCAFSHGHILAHAEFDGEPRFGANIIDLQLMEPAKATDDNTVFAGVEGDEDPDFYFDEEKNKWYMAICRLFRSGKNYQYRYVFFESDDPFYGYKYIGIGEEDNACETGGSFVRIDGNMYFACGNSFVAKSDYRIYGKDGLCCPTFDFIDGGFRGWGSIIPVKLGTRTRHFLITFDRHGGSSYTWSYGNLYCFEME